MKKIDIDSLRVVLIKTFNNSDVPNSINNLAMGDLKDWDSLGNFNILLAIEQKYQIKFDLDEMSKIRSIADILSSLKEKA